MRRLAWLAAVVTARAAPDTDTLLTRAAALARWANRTGPAPPSWTVTSPKDVTVGHEVHAGKIKKVSRGTTKADLGGASIIIKTIEHGENGTLLMSEKTYQSCAEIKFQSPRPSTPSTPSTR